MGKVGMAGKGGNVGLGKVGMVGRAGGGATGAVSNKRRAARPTPAFDDSTATNITDRKRQALEAIVVEVWAGG